MAQRLLQLLWRDGVSRLGLLAPALGALVRVGDAIEQLDHVARVFRYPAIDAAAFRAKVARAFATDL